MLVFLRVPSNYFRVEYDLGLQSLIKTTEALLNPCRKPARCFAWLHHEALSPSLPVAGLGAMKAATECVAA